MPLYAFSFIDRYMFDPLTEEWLPNDEAAKREAVLVAEDLDQRNKVRPIAERYNGVLVVKKADREIVRLIIGSNRTR